MIYTDRGIVIKQINFGDYDRILSIITRNHGKISVVAKGVRKTTSKKASSCDLFVNSRFSFAEGRNLDILTEAEPLDSYEFSKRSLTSSMTLFYISELIDHLVEESDSTLIIPAYELLTEFLDALEETGDESFIPSLVRGFEMKLIEHMGLSPNMNSCIKCAKPLNSEMNLFFSIDEGGILCPVCGEDMPTSNLISIDTIKVLKFLRRSRFYLIKNLQLTERVKAETKYFTQGILEYFHGLELKSNQFYSS